MIMPEQYKIRIPTFEGPLDLLLHLIKENEIDIYDIPIALITRQYIDYIDLMKELDLDIAGDFLVMAATLVHIKSRMLLPVDEQQAGEEPPADPRLELVYRLLEYKSFKEAALALKEMGDSRACAVTRPPELDEGKPEEDQQQELSLFDLDLFSLITAFRQILEKVPAEMANITRAVLTVNDKIARIIQALEEKDTVRFEDLFEAGAPRSHLIVTFVALLEILKLGLARVHQAERFGPIWVMKAEKMDETAEAIQEDWPDEEFSRKEFRKLEKVQEKERQTQ